MRVQDLGLFGFRILCLTFRDDRHGGALFLGMCHESWTITAVSHCLKGDRDTVSGATYFPQGPRPQVMQAALPLCSNVWSCGFRSEGDL